MRALFNEEESIVVEASALGKIVILNGPPRSGKTSIAHVIQESFTGVWMNLGVDGFMQMMPEKYQPGIGLRPGGERPDLEPLIVDMYAAMYESIAAHSRRGIHVVVDVGHHDYYSTSLGILATCATILEDLPVLFVGIHCPIEVIMERRIQTWQMGYEEDGSVPAPVERWQKHVHFPGEYDLTIDTSTTTPEQSAKIIQEYLEKEAPSKLFQQE